MFIDTMEKYPKVAVIYLSYYSVPYIDDALRALSGSSYPKDRLELVIVDNPHKEFGLSKAYIEEHIVPRSQKDLPHITYLPQTENTGFCGGNNVGIEWALQHGCEYVYLHNQDGFVAPDCIEKLVEVMEQDKTIGCAQSAVLLHPEIQKINTIGNSFHYLGFGYISNFGETFNPQNVPVVKDVEYASGASLMLRSSIVQTYGALEKDLFAYHEDIEYSLRMRMLGYRVVAVTSALFFHKYIFNRNKSKFFYMERNRYAILLTFYKWSTLVLLLPALVFMEIGLFFFFMKQGWFKERMNVYKYWLKKEHLALWLGKRKHIQSIRTISDHTFFKSTSSTVLFGEKKDMNNPLLLYVANPFLRMYGWIIKRILFW